MTSAARPSCHSVQCQVGAKVVSKHELKISKKNNCQRIFRESVVVAGVEQGSSSVENFHGLKPLHLPLMFQKRRGGS